MCGDLSIDNNFSQIVKNLSSKKKITEAESKKLIEAIMPYLYYLEAIEQNQISKNIYNANGVLVKPGQAVSLDMQTYCLDSKLPAPKSGEKMRLVNYRELIHPDFADLYARLMNFSAKHPQYNKQIQGIVWGIRDISQKNSHAYKLSQTQLKILNTVMNGGANFFIGKRNEMARKEQIRAGIRNFLAKQGINEKTFRMVNIADSVLEGDIAGTLAALEKKPVNMPIPNDTSNYTLLSLEPPEKASIPSNLIAQIYGQTRYDVQPSFNQTVQRPLRGVAARIVSKGGASKTRLELVNTTSRPYHFKAWEHTAQSVRPVQNLAFGGNIGNPKSYDFIFSDPANCPKVTNPKEYKNATDKILFALDILDKVDTVITIAGLAAAICTLNAPAAGVLLGKALSKKLAKKGVKQGAEFAVKNGGKGLSKKRVSNFAAIAKKESDDTAEIIARQRKNSDLQLNNVDPDGSFAPGTVGAARAWSIKSRLKTAELPTSGKIRFIPRKNYHPSEALRRGPNGGYVDRFGNEWVKPRGRIQGDAHWDVQLSSHGKETLGRFSKSGNHINVSKDGRILH